MLSLRTMSRIGCFIAAFLLLNTGIAGMYSKGYSYETWWHGLGFGPYAIGLGIFFLALGFLNPKNLYSSAQSRKKRR